jgi:hypothetical protein
MWQLSEQRRPLLGPVRPDLADINDAKSRGEAPADDARAERGSGGAKGALRWEAPP